MTGTHTVSFQQTLRHGPSCKIEPGLMDSTELRMSPSNWVVPESLSLPLCEILTPISPRKGLLAPDGVDDSSVFYNGPQSRTLGVLGASHTLYSHLLAAVINLGA